ncbi:hypothetical protein AeRB84_017670 [Aphanomyces euteiches]|nr:hypothetical protein AeRB84_017670 [Aphanomyces euteiches]
MNHDMMPARVESAGSKAYGASWCAILHSSSGRPVAVVLSHPNDGAPFCVTLKKDCPTTISMQFEQVPVSSPSVESLTATQNDSKATVDEAQRKLEWACLFCVVFMVVELLGGYFAGSLAIMSDAAHLLSDVLSFFLSLFALYLSKRPATASMPFGYKRAEAIGALASIIVIWMLTIGLVWAAVQRILALTKSPSPHTIPQVNGRVMFVVAFMGLIVNIALMKILGHGHSHGGHGHSHGGHGHSHGHSHEKHGHSHGSHEHSHGNHGHSHGVHHHGHAHGDHDESTLQPSCETPHSHDDSHNEKDCSHHLTELEGSSRSTVDSSIDCESDLVSESCAAENLNVRAAYLHALGDFLQSLGVCLAGALIWYEPSWQLCDPIVTLFFSIIVVATTVGICRTTLHLLMEGTPSTIDVVAIEEAVRALPNVKDMHDVRVWSISSSSFALAMHVVERKNVPSKSLVMTVQECILTHHEFDFMTIQVEQEGDAAKCSFNQRLGVDVVV